jgi:site-specific DNA-methyltransferase (adenine-specific)
MQIETLADGVTLYCGDCREVMPTLNLWWGTSAVVTDPPYGIAYKSPSGRGLTERGDYPVIVGDTEPFDPAPFLGFPHVILWGANHYADKLPASAAWLVWDKRDGMTSNNNSDVELAWVNSGGSARLIRHLWNGMLKASERDERRCHPTQKPIAVMRWCIEHLPTDVDTIFDPFMGSGPTGIAAVQLGRKFIGIEIEPKYFDASRRRIDAALKQRDLFTEAPRPAEQQTLALK